MKVIRWGSGRRFQFIETRLFWEGRVNRSDLTNNFGISVPQATADLARYQDLAPGNMDYDTKAKAYIATPQFTPRFADLSSDNFLTQFKLVAEGIMPREELSSSSALEFAIVPTPTRIVDKDILRAIFRSIISREQIEIYYQSMSRPEPIWRWVTPHALAYDGFRWHARAFCHLTKAFKDFLLTRVLDTGERRSHAIDHEMDREWSLFVNLKVGPHPQLSEDQRRIVELDYGMENGCFELKTRAALLYYVNKRLGLNGAEQRDPQEQQIVLLNNHEIQLQLSALWQEGPS